MPFSKQSPASTPRLELSKMSLRGNRRRSNQPTLGDGLRRSFSFEPLSTTYELSDSGSSSSSEDGPFDLDRSPGGKSRLISLALLNTG